MGSPKSTSILKPFSSIVPEPDCLALEHMANSLFLPNECQPAYLPPVARIHDKWSKAAYWIACEIVPEIDINRTPYIRDSYKPTRFFAKTLYCLLQLCKGVWENSPEAREYSGYENHWHWWLECTLELKLYEVLRLLNLTPHRALHPTKAEEIKEHREFLHCLRQREMPEQFDRVSKSLHLRRLFEEAMYLCRIPEFKDEYWDPYIDTYQRYIEDFRKQTLIQTVIVPKGRNTLWQRGKGRYFRRVPIGKLLSRNLLVGKERTQTLAFPIVLENPELGKKEDALRITIKPWKSQLVYVLKAPHS